MRKEIRENVEITIYTENEIKNIKTKIWCLENDSTDYITFEDFQKVEQAKAERLAKEEKERLARTDEELIEIKKEIERLEHAKFIEEMADRLDWNSYNKICIELNELKKIIKANED